MAFDDCRNLIYSGDFFLLHFEWCLVVFKLFHFAAKLQYKSAISSFFYLHTQLDCSAMTLDFWYGIYCNCRYITSDDVVELKGKVACEISSADELTLTELMFNGVLKDIKVEEMVSLLSCFVWQEKLQDAAKPREELDLLFTQLQDTARRVAKLQLECKVHMEPFLKGFCFLDSCALYVIWIFRITLKS
jgi:hypothetical protein